jgi:hypothetical protein
MKQPDLRWKYFRTSAASCAVIIATALGAAAQQVQVDNKTSDSKTAPSAPLEPPNIAPQMIGDLGFGVTLSPAKIAENESPRPENRIFFTYNYFNEVRLQPGFQIDGIHIDVHREVIGFEKTFLGGDASFGVRLPFSTVNENFFGDKTSETNFGNLSLITKYAFINDTTTGNVLAGGLSLVLPTETGEPESRPVLFQPFLGGVYNWGNFYLQGFTSVIIPTDSRDPTLFYNDIGVGYFLYRNPNFLIRGIVPTLEWHITTPAHVHNEDENSDTWVTLTPGVHLQVGQTTTITLGASVPVTGPKPFDVEGIAQLNFRF